jgi:hypothetical protein
VGAKDEACVSLYVPTSPLRTQARANRIAFKDLAEEALSLLKKAGIDKRRIEPLQEQFGYLAGMILENTGDNQFRYREQGPAEEIDEFWGAQANGLAVLAIPEMLRTFRLPDRLKPLAEVADLFIRRHSSVP